MTKCKPSKPSISHQSYFQQHATILQTHFPNAKVSIHAHKLEPQSSSWQRLIDSAKKFSNQNVICRVVHILGTRKQVSCFISNDIRIEISFDAKEFLVEFVEEKANETLVQLQNVWNDLYPS